MFHIVVAVVVAAAAAAVVVVAAVVAVGRIDCWNSLPLHLKTGQMLHSTIQTSEVAPQ